MHHFLYDLLILAAKKSSVAAPVDTGKSLSLSWAIVGVGLIVGLLVTLSPTKRSSEIKKSKHD
jgi:hypothetical protein